MAKEGLEDKALRPLGKPVRVVGDMTWTGVLKHVGLDPRVFENHGYTLSVELRSSGTLVDLERRVGEYELRGDVEVVVNRTIKETEEDMIAIFD